MAELRANRWSRWIPASRLITGRAEREAEALLLAVTSLTRLKIIRALAEGPLAASDLARVTGRTPSGASQHLRVLREAGAVTAERRGNIVMYRLSTERAGVMLEAVARAFDAFPLKSGRDR